LAASERSEVRRKEEEENERTSHVASERFRSQRKEESEI
jgi:hypothetical protein